MKLYVCYGTFKHSLRPGARHPCGYAYHALKDAGHDPEVIRTYGLGLGPEIAQRLAPGRRGEVEELTGKRTVPVLVTDDGEVITESKRIEEWAAANPA
jgi:hypothetical protein